MRKTTLFTLDRDRRTRSVPRKRHEGKVFDFGATIDLRYSWDAYPERPARSLSSGGWTSALEDDLGDDPDRGQVTPTGPEVPPPPPVPSRLVEPEPSVVTPVKTPAPAVSKEPDVTPAPAIPVIPPPEHSTSGTSHDDRFTKAITDAARGILPESAPPPPTDEEDEPAASPNPTAMSHAFFERLGERIAHANTFDAGTFQVGELFKRIDRDVEAQSAERGQMESLSDADVVEDLAAILEAAPEELRTTARAKEPGLEATPDITPSAPVRAVATSATPLEKLQKYLGVGDAVFTGFETRYFETLKAHLVRAGTVEESATVDRSNFATAVTEFQGARGLDDDGIPGEDTLWELERDWALGRNLSVRRVDADVWLRPPLTEDQYVPDDHGYRSFRFRQDAADLYDGLRREVLAAGAIITSSGSLRALDATVTSGRSAKSMHYSGLAYDLATVTGMRDPDVDPYIIVSEGDRWRVWSRTDSGSDQTLEAVVWAGGSTSSRRVTAKVVDFTALAARHGFEPIPPRSSFPENYLSAEWWHFQANTLLVPWISQFGIELLSLAQYSEDQVRAVTGIWNNRKAIFKRLPAARGWH